MKLFAALFIGSLIGFAASEARNSVARSRLESDLSRARQQSLAWMELSEEYQKECHGLHKQLEALE